MQITWVVAFLCVFLQSSLAIYVKKTVKTTAPFAESILGNFGLAIGGQITLDYSLSPRNPQLPYDVYVVIAVVTQNQLEGFYNEVGDKTVTSASTVATLCMQPSMARIVASSQGSFNMTISEDYDAEQYSVILMQCRSVSSDNPVDITVEVNMKNPSPTGSSFTHLSIEDVNLLRLFGGEGILYMLLILAVVGQFVFYRSQIKEIHMMFAVTLVATFIVVMLDYNYYVKYDQQGYSDMPSQMAANAFAAIADSLALGTIFLLSLGWKLLRSQLTEREQRLVGYSVLSFFVFSFGAAMCGSSGGICTSVSLVAFILRNLLLLAIIVAMNFTVTHVRILLTHSPWVPSTPIQYARCKQFQMFRLVYILYLFMPTIIYIVQISSFTWREDWIVTSLNEMTTIGMLCFIGVTFSPMQEAFLLRAFDGSINAVRR